MRFLRFAIAALCGALVTGLVYEHRNHLETWLASSSEWNLRLGRATLADEPLPDREPAPIPIVPVAWPEPVEAAVVAAPLEPAWHIVDAALNGSSDHQLAVRTVSGTTSGPIAMVAATQAKPASSAAIPKWEVIGLSAGNRPIHVRKTGIGPDITLIVAGLDGEDRVAVKWIDQLSQRIDESPELVADRQLILLRAINPDGLTVKQPGNAHGVMLNRNFPTAAYRAGGLLSAGSGPASEPETRAVLKMLAELRPHRIIHVQSANNTAAVSNSKSTAAIQAWHQALSTRPQTFDPNHEPGSLEDYAATVLGLEVVSLHLPTGDDWRSAGLTHVPTLLAMSAPITAIDSPTATIALKDPATDHSLSASPFSPVDDNEPVARPIRKGYEELPPPPFKPNW
jgi:hypothetical protein